MQQVILASSSERRAYLLNKIGVFPIKILPANINEEPREKENSTALVKRVAFEKASKIFNDNKNNLQDNTFIIAADTLVVRGTVILGKPKNIEEAAKYLGILSGRNHKVLTGICIMNAKGEKSLRVVKSIVKLKRLNNKEISMYLNTNEWQGKSGGYSIQGVFEMFVYQIKGSYSSIIGLPLAETYSMLTGLGYKYNYAN